MEQNTLYRKYRPRIFDDVVGQDVIVRTLRNQIEKNKVGHAYLFCGTRGTGKTTIAKIFARSINCKNQKLGNPCNTCTTCSSILDGSNLNVQEIDAASNNGIDDIRRIISLLSHPPVDGEKYKVFIIDEAHSLSQQASNALLKTLEEPEEYAVFILCTTEPEKLLDTIRSRCQRYDFTRIELDVIKKQLKKICDLENIKIDDDALSFIATKGDGSMRDSISLLERCRGFIKDESITMETCKNVLGTVDFTDFSVIFRALLRQDTREVFEKIGDIIDKGKDISIFTSDFIWFLRNVLVVKTIDMPSDKLAITKEAFDDYKKIAMETTVDVLVYFIEKMSELEHKLKISLEKRIMLETTMLVLSTPQSDFMESSYMARLSRLETNIDNSSYSQIKVSREELSHMTEENKKDKLIKEIKVDKATYEDIKGLKDKMNEIISNMDFTSKNAIMSSNILPSSDKNDGVVNIVPTSDPVYGVFLKDKTILEKLEENTKKVLKKEVKYRLLDGKKEHISNEVLITIEELGVPVEVEA